ncbi:hypothetical protein M5362_30505 [Streptomyces sp. Je 1-79]|uniref:hypothetical protein n=1 Tax=Streptomyces sp. Je 1-79 TaxID=2943847 RepID=UPI0021A60798|nr:hypothetical protein [Streptomyces sp. Je 1-79]MCT4357440.1 hypothetical protein [Streptomyces sp. Je 1-79]
MTSLYTAPIGSGRRRLAEPRLEESVPQPPQPPPAPTSDPPIYKALISQWASHGRTLPGRTDQEWNRLTAAPVWADRTVRVSGVSGTLVSGSLVRQGGVR